MAEPSYNYSYTPTVDHRESNLYREEYFSSTDTKIYFNDIEQTEIGFIQYEIQEQLKPVYGYNSRTFDDVVIGNRIVTGTFSVPIKNKDKQIFDVSQMATYMGEQQISSGDVEKYNSDEEQALYSTEWFGSTKRNIDSNNNVNIDSEYLTKLIALNYNVNVYASLTSYTKAIKQFQKDHYCTVTGDLNQMTKNKIDDEFSKLNAKPIVLDGSTGYNDQGLTRGAKKLSGDGLILNTISGTNSKTYRVMDSNGNIYYIKGIVGSEDGE